MIPRQKLDQSENLSLQKYSLEPIIHGSDVDETEKIVVKALMMEAGDMNIAIFTAIRAVFSDLLGVMGTNRFEIQFITTDDIRTQQMTHKQLVDWFLDSHIHLITKSLMLSIVKDRIEFGNELYFWVRSLSS